MVKHRLTMLSDIHTRKKQRANDLQIVPNEQINQHFLRDVIDIMNEIWFSRVLINLVEKKEENNQRHKVPLKSQYKNLE